jgi:hypothetical protein
MARIATSTVPTSKRAVNSNDGVGKHNVPDLASHGPASHVHERHGPAHASKHPPMKLSR